MERVFSIQKLMLGKSVESLRDVSASLDAVIVATPKELSDQHFHLHVRDGYLSEDIDYLGDILELKLDQPSGFGYWIESWDGMLYQIELQTPDGLLTISGMLKDNGNRNVCMLGKGYNNEETQFGVGEFLCHPMNYAAPRIKSFCQMKEGFLVNQRNSEVKYPDSLVALLESWRMLSSIMIPVYPEMYKLLYIEYLVSEDINADFYRFLKNRYSFNMSTNWNLIPRLSFYVRKLLYDENESRSYRLQDAINYSKKWLEDCTKNPAFLSGLLESDDLIAEYIDLLNASIDKLETKSIDLRSSSSNINVKTYVDQTQAHADKTAYRIPYIEGSYEPTSLELYEALSGVQECMFLIHDEILLEQHWDEQASKSTAESSTIWFFHDIGLAYSGHKLAKSPHSTPVPMQNYMNTIFPGSSVEAIRPDPKLPTTRS